MKQAGFRPGRLLAVRRRPEGKQQAACAGLEQLTIRCSGLGVGEDKRGQEAEAGDATASAMHPDAATRSRSKHKHYG